MDSQQVRNLQEAYIGVYDGDIREKLEFESWVNNLLEEGYDLSDYTWDELYKSYFNEAQYTPPQQIQQPAAEVRKAPNKNTQNPAVPVLTGLALAKLGNEISKKKRKKGPDVKGVFEEWVTGLLDEGYDLSEYTWDELSEIYNIVEAKKPLPIGKMKKKEMELMSKADKALGPALRTPMNSPERNAALRTSERGSNISDVRRSVSTRGGKMKFPMPEVGRYKPKNEEVDLYDTILSHLIDEGYADTIESAERIMVNMSEDWRESIMEGMKALPVGKMDAKTKELKSKFLKSKPGSPEAGKLISRASQITGTRDKQTV